MPGAGADAGVVAAERAAMALAPVQADMLGLPPVPETRQADLARRRPGRPVGARNRRSEDSARLAVEKFGDPIWHGLALATMPTEELALRLGCTPLEAAELQQRERSIVLPYIHARRPQAVNVDLNLPTLVLADPRAYAAMAAQAATVEVLDNQSLSEAADAPL